MATKTQGASVLSLQQVSGNSILISSVQSLSTQIFATVFVGIARLARPDGGMVRLRLEANPNSAGDGFWVPVMTHLALATGQAPTTNVTGTVGSGTNVITVSNTENFRVGDLIFIQNSTIGNSEFGRVKSISENTSLIIEDNLANAQTGSTIYGNAEFHSFNFDCTGYYRVRLVVDTLRCSQPVAVVSTMVSAV